MKFKLLLLFTLISIGVSVKAQGSSASPYWVVESSVHASEGSVVRIYNEHDALVHEIKLSSRLDVSNRKHRKAVTQMMKKYYHREAAARKRNKFKSSV